MEVKYSKVIKRKDGRYSAYAWTDETPRRYAYGKTSSECKRNLSEIIAQIESGMISDTSTVQEYATHWLTSKKQHLSPTTYERYTNDLNNYIFPAIGAKKVCNVMQAEIQRLMSNYGKTHAEKSSKNLLGILHSLFDSARINRIISFNPCEGVKIVQTPPYEYYIYSDSEMATLMEKLSGHPAIVPISLIAYCGLRPSEALGLQWEDIDFKDHTLTIRRTAVSVGGTVVVKDTAKTKESRSTTYIPTDVLKIIGPYRGIGYVYKSKNGGPISVNLFSNWFRKFLKRNNLKHTRLYDLRHYTATTLMDAGLPDTVISQYMRHTTTNMTKKYQHIREQTRRAAAEAMDQVIKSKMS